MHNTFLNERIYETLVDVARQYSLKRINRLEITVKENSLLTAESLQNVFIEKQSNLVGDFTVIEITKNDVGNLKAIIESVEGETH